MLSSDKASYAALQALTNTGEQHRRPIVLWIGAGASAWAGFPLWQVLASRMHSKFSRTEATYNNATAAKELAAGNFPAVFQQMQQSDGRLYFNELADTFKTITPGPVYSRMLRTLERIRPLHILTTNVDETLERSLSSVITVQSSDIERINLLMQQRESFVCKLHGTVSAIQSMVFTESDYRRLTNNATYLAAIREIFSVATVVFVGYSLRDEYLIQLLSDSDKQRPLFGTGPHFVITSSETLHLPDSVKQVRY